VHETGTDLQRLQRLLDTSYEDSGRHLRRVGTPERRLDADTLAYLLDEVRILAVATVTADGRPLVGPVDGLFYRGEFWFGSADDAVRVCHLRARPSVSATHVVGEELVVTVHGRAEEIDLSLPTNRGFRECCLEVYGHDWEEWGASAPYFWIRAEKMFAFAFTDPEAA